MFKRDISDVKWNVVAMMVEGRSGKQVRDRWYGCMCISTLYIINFNISIGTINWTLPLKRDDGLTAKIMFCMQRLENLGPGMNYKVNISMLPFMPPFV